MKKFLKRIYYSLFSFRSLSRITLDKLLIPEIKLVKSKLTLDIGSKASPYRKYIVGDYYNTDIFPDENLSFVSSIYNLPVRDKAFDFVLCTEVLEHLNEPKKATEELHRVLIRGGICILTTRFMFPYHGDPEDYFRFTDKGLKHLFSKFQHVRVISHGNRFQLILYLIAKNKIIRPLIQPLCYLASFIETKKSKYAFGYIVVAKK